MSRPGEGIPNWVKVTAPLFLLTGVQIIRVFLNKEYVRTFVQLNHSDVILWGEEATKEYERRHADVIVPRAGRRVARVAQVLATLLMANPELKTTFPGGCCDWRFSVVNTAVVRGVSFPNGYIFLHQGLLDTAASDDELAFVLAHELAVVCLEQTEVYLNSRMSVWKVIAFILAPVSLQMYARPIRVFVASNFLKLKPGGMIEVQEELCNHRQLVTAADAKAAEYVTKACYDQRAVSSLLMKFYLQENMHLFWRTRGPEGERYRTRVTDPTLKMLSTTIPEWRKNRSWTSKDRFDIFSDDLERMEKTRQSICRKPLPDKDPRRFPHRMSDRMNKFIVDSEKFAETSVWLTPRPSRSTSSSVCSFESLQSNFLFAANGAKDKNTTRKVHASSKSQSSKSSHSTGSSSRLTKLSKKSTRS